MSTDPLTWVEIDLAAVRTNVATLKSFVPSATHFCAVVKSNAYGHGLVPVARSAIQAGAGWIGVVAAEEALALREAGVVVPILVLGIAPSPTWPDLADRQIQLTIADQAQLTALEQYRGALLSVHLKVETGLGRLGFLPSELPTIVRRVAQYQHFQLVGVSSHFATVEEQDLVYTAYQLAELKRATQFADQPLIRHIAATAAILQLPESHLDLVRVGIGIYGLWPSEGVRQAVTRSNPSIQLAPALSWRTRLVHVKAVAVGTSVGYGRTHTVTEPTIVGVLPIGYADGYDRSLSNRSHVLAGGQRVPVIGRVAMNMTMVDLTQVPHVRVGDEVTLIGRDHDEEIAADDLAQWAETINYEIVTRLPEHLERRYLNADPSLPISQKR